MMINLLIEGMTNNVGGKETYIVNLFNFLDRTKYNITFVAYDKEIAYEKMLYKCGAEIVYLPPRHIGFIKHCNALNRLFKTKQFDVVWSHKTTLCACELLFVAKKYNVPVRMVHSHSSSNMGGKLTLLMHIINKKFIFSIANEYLACSFTAAKWFYNNYDAKIMLNGINIEKFKYNSSVREAIRKKLNLQDNYVIGHIGRFGKEKNHRKLIDVFKICRQQNKKTRLVLCGDGEERINIEQQIYELGIHSDVIFLGVVDNVNEILQAMDIIVMPSLFEGLPFALLEAQAAGLRFVASNTISKEVDITKWNQFLPLSLDDNLWADSILKIGQEYDRSIGYDIMKNSGFDIAENARIIDEFISSKFEQSLK